MIFLLVCLCTTGIQRTGNAGKDFISPAKDSCELPRGYWILTPNILEKQAAPFTTEPSLQPQ